jgi:hypothetical protein
MRAAAILVGLIAASVALAQPKSGPSSVPVFPTAPGGGLKAPSPPPPPPTPPSSIPGGGTPGGSGVPGGSGTPGGTGAPASMTPVPGAPPTGGSLVSPPGGGGGGNVGTPPGTPGLPINVAPGTQPPVPPVTVTPPPGPQQAEPGELLVAWRSSAEADAGIAEIQARFGVAPIERVPLPALARVLAVYRFASAGEAATARAQLAAERPQLLVDLNTLYFPLADPRQYAASQVDLPGGAAPPGAPARVGMLDTRVEPVPALAGTTVVRKRFSAADAVPAFPAHGTAVATLLTGRDAARGFEGAAAGAELYAGEVMRVRAGREDTNARIVLEGLDWLLAENVRVVNLSLGGAPNRLLADATETILARTVVVVAAAGNAGPGAPPSYPAAYPGVIAVTANDAAGRVYDRANHGGYIALSAPGVDVWVPDAGSGRYVSGTSFAAAWVSGAAARLVGQSPRLKPPQVRAQFCAAARDLGAPGRDAVFGCGLLQMKRALEFAGGR